MKEKLQLSVEIHYSSSSLIICSTLIQGKVFTGALLNIQKSNNDKWTIDPDLNDCFINTNCLLNITKDEKKTPNASYILEMLDDILGPYLDSINSDKVEQDNNTNHHATNPAEEIATVQDYNMQLNGNISYISPAALFRCTYYRNPAIISDFYHSNFINDKKIDNEPSILANTSLDHKNYYGKNFIWPWPLPSKQQILHIKKANNQKPRKYICTKCKSIKSQRLPLIKSLQNLNDPNKLNSESQTNHFPYLKQKCTERSNLNLINEKNSNQPNQDFQTNGISIKMEAMQTSHSLNDLNEASTTMTPIATVYITQNKLNQLTNVTIPDCNTSNYSFNMMKTQKVLKRRLKTRIPQHKFCSEDGKKSIDQNYTSPCPVDQTSLTSLSPSLAKSNQNPKSGLENRKVPKLRLKIPKTTCCKKDDVAADPVRHETCNSKSKPGNDIFYDNVKVKTDPETSTTSKSFHVTSLTTPNNVEDKLFDKTVKHLIERPRLKMILKAKKVRVPSLPSNNNNNAMQVTPQDFTTVSTGYSNKSNHDNTSFSSPLETRSCNSKMPSIYNEFNDDNKTVYADYKNTVVAKSLMFPLSHYDHLSTMQTYNSTPVSNVSICKAVPLKFSQKGRKLTAVVPYAPHTKTPTSSTISTKRHVNRCKRNGNNINKLATSAPLASTTFSGPGNQLTHDVEDNRQLISDKTSTSCINLVNTICMDGILRRITAVPSPKTSSSNYYHPWLLHLGDVVWAKIQGYPWWPAQIVEFRTRHLCQPHGSRVSCSPADSTTSKLDCCSAPYIHNSVIDSKDIVEITPKIDNNTQLTPVVNEDDSGMVNKNNAIVPGVVQVCKSCTTRCLLSWYGGSSPRLISVVSLRDVLPYGPFFDRYSWTFGTPDPETRPESADTISLNSNASPSPSKSSQHLAHQQPHHSAISANPVEFSNMQATFKDALAQATAEYKAHTQNLSLTNL